MTSFADETGSAPTISETRVIAHPDSGVSTGRHITLGRSGSSFYSSEHVYSSTVDSILADVTAIGTNTTD